MPTSSETLCILDKHIWMTNIKFIMNVFCSNSISKPTTFLARQGHESGVMSADSSWQNIFDETDGEFLEPYPPTQTNLMAKFLTI